MTSLNGGEGFTKDDLLELKEQNISDSQIVLDPEFKSKNQTNNILEIPEDMWTEQIFQYSSFNDVISMSGTNKYFHQVTCNFTKKF
jgi:hypothetical protein